MMYGFKGELDQKFSKEQVKPVYAVCKKLFAALPLAACIGKATLILHGGLFRKPTPTGGSKSKVGADIFTHCLGGLRDILLPYNLSLSV